jgi:putative transposase
VAFVIDAYARRIVGWRVSRTAHASRFAPACSFRMDATRPLIPR